MAKWNVYRSSGYIVKETKPKRLGTIEAKNGPDAILKAWAKWPKHIDEGLAQRGFFVRRAETDPYDDDWKHTREMCS
jgi:hypothetical protein